MTRSESGPVHPSNKKSLISVGRYQMLRVLGKGNFARVEEAVHTLLNVKVAVKVIDTGAIREDYVFKNLTREARLLSKLRHPNIVRLYETIQCGSVYYLVIELATGGDLSTHIKNQPLCRLDEKTAKGYGRQLVSALEHMHSKGIVHRDLKMENIMLQDPWKERIKIVDFGLSNMYTGESLLKTHCGSPEYAAPELFVVGKRYGPEVDLWSLGVVFYAMATGRLPFQSPRDGQTSSEEHRRKLLTQINRGLTQAQKKTIASMSGEYRNLVNRLLVPTAHKRITIQELCFHPWIANRLKNVASKASQADLIALEHNTIVDEIAKATNMDRTFIERDILQSKYGEIGGMYNIKAHVMRQVGSFHAFKARSWITATQPARYTSAQNNHTTENFRPAGFHVNPESTSTTSRRSMVFQRSLPSELAASSNGGSRGGTWTPKNSKTTSSATCPAHGNHSATSPGVQGSVAHHVRWESSADRMQSHIIAKTINKSVAGFAERPVTRQPSQPMSRIVPPREVRTIPNVHPAYLRPEISLHHDPVEHWINQKLKNLEKRDRSCLREQTHHASSQNSEQFQPVAVEAEYDARNDRPSPPTIQTLCKDIRSNQSGAMGQGDRVTERCFYRSPAAKTDVRTTRVALSTGTRTSERNIRRSRPLTACTESHNPSLTKAEPKHGATKTSNKREEASSIEQIGAAIRSAISAHERRSAKVSSPCKGASLSRRSLAVASSGTPMSDQLRERLQNVRAEIRRSEAAQREAPAFHCHFKEN